MCCWLIFSQRMKFQNLVSMCLVM
uniref:Uncharacterized protein n=1 Tax=Arundo donax TaxID=35708 RepID=A0A0A8ZHW2_ARUDO